MASAVARVHPARWGSTTRRRMSASWLAMVDMAGSMPNEQAFARCSPERELSVTLYHEILEATAAASADPPASVMDFNEADFERTAYAMPDELGEASPENLNR